MVFPLMVEFVHPDEKKVLHFLWSKMKGTAGIRRLRNPLKTDREKQNGCV